MSRSKRKTPIIGNTTRRSEKRDKILCNRKVRRLSRSVLCRCTCVDICSCVYPQKRDALDKWLMSKDGKHWVLGCDRGKLMRK